MSIYISSDRCLCMFDIDLRKCKSKNVTIKSSNVQWFRKFFQISAWICKHIGRKSYNQNWPGGPAPVWVCEPPAGPPKLALSSPAITFHKIFAFSESSPECVLMVFSAQRNSLGAFGTPNESCGPTWGSGIFWANSVDWAVKYFHLKSRFDISNLVALKTKFLFHQYHSTS